MRIWRSLASRLVVLGVVQMVLLAVTAGVIFVAEGPHEPGHPDEHVTPERVHALERIADDPVALAAGLAELHAERIEVSIYDAQHHLVASNVDPPLAIPHGEAIPHDDPGAPPLDGHADRSKPALDPGQADRSSTLDASQADRSSPPLDAGQADRPSQPLEAGQVVDPSPDRAPDPARSTSPTGRSSERFRRHANEPSIDGRRFPPISPPGRLRRLVVPLHVHGEPGVLVARGVHGEPPGLTGPVLVLICGFAILVVGALLAARWIVRPIERLSRTARALGGGDLTARSRLERSDEIGELGRRFDEMADRIATLLVTEKELLANVAHELRTPLTRIGVALDLAGEGDAGAARVALGEIAVDVSELEQIVDDILTAMRFEVAGQLPLRRAVTEPRAIAVACAERLRARHPTRRLELAIADGIPAIDVDPVLVRRVLDNLVDNAHKYTPDPDAPIRLAVERAGDRVALSVSDSGIGIPADDLPRVFTAFFRGDRSRSRETGGVGLGLTLAKRIVEVHGGTITVTSEPGAGTTVRVVL